MEAHVVETHREFCSATEYVSTYWEQCLAFFSLCDNNTSVVYTGFLVLLININSEGKLHTSSERAVSISQN